MSNPGETDATPITSRAQLAEFLAVGGKPREAWRIGTEHEKFGFRRPDAGGSCEPIPYAPNGIGALLAGIAAQGYEEIRDQGALIALKRPGGESISLEPGGQFELSGRPLADLHQTRAEFAAHYKSVLPVAGPMGIGFALLGFHPTASRAAMPWMPKSRYAIMRDYMPRVGTLGLDMMLRTCTVQTNLDFADERDMREKLRISLALQPLATAMFANSPFTEGKPNGYLSYRAHIWTDTDNGRAGTPACFLEADFGFARYVEYLLDVPMYFIARDGRLIDATAYRFRDFLDGRADGLRGYEPTLGDFADHVTTVFTDVRIKRFLEMRGADAGSTEMMLAASAFWVGLLYDGAAQAAAASLIAEAPIEAFIAMRAEVPRAGMMAAAPGAPGRRARDLARAALSIAHQGLRARGLGEEGYLTPLHEIAAGAPTQAERWLERYRGDWAGDISRIFIESAI